MTAKSPLYLTVVLSNILSSPLFSIPFQRPRIEICVNENIWWHLSEHTHDGDGEKGSFSEKSLVRSIKKHDNDDAAFLKQSIRSM